MTAPLQVPLPGEAHGQRGGAVRAMFDRIAPRYDLLNRVMTLQVDQAWRRRLLRDLDPRDGETLLDLCAGTMDVADLARRRADLVLPDLQAGLGEDHVHRDAQRRAVLGQEVEEPLGVGGARGAGDAHHQLHGALMPAPP